jgi:uncharacterized membrane protein HdeD (DUF308 family)
VNIAYGWVVAGGIALTASLAVALLVWGVVRVVKRVTRRQK